MSKVGGGPIDNSTSEDDATRMIYHAMVHYLDDAIGNLVKEWQAKHMWENTLMWFVSDNGGPIYAGGNNFPLRGGVIIIKPGCIRRCLRRTAFIHAALSAAYHCACR